MMKILCAIFCVGVLTMSSLLAEENSFRRAPCEEGWFHLNWEDMIYASGEGVESSSESIPGVWIYSEYDDTIDIQQVAYLSEKMNIEGAMISGIEEEQVMNVYELCCDRYAHFFYFPKDKVFFFTTMSLRDLQGFIEETNQLESVIGHESESRSLSIAFSQNTQPYFILVKNHDRRDRGERCIEGGITGKWGEGNGIEWEGYVSGSVHDAKGNYIEGRVTQRDDKSGEVTVRGGHEEKNK